MQWKNPIVFLTSNQCNANFQLQENVILRALYNRGRRQLEKIAEHCVGRDHS